MEWASEEAKTRPFPSCPLVVTRRSSFGYDVIRYMAYIRAGLPTYCQDSNTHHVSPTTVSMGLIKDVKQKQSCLNNQRVLLQQAY